MQKDGEGTSYLIAYKRIKESSFFEHLFTVDSDQGDQWHLAYSNVTIEKDHYVSIYFLLWGFDIGVNRDENFKGSCMVIIVATGKSGKI